MRYLKGSINFGLCYEQRDQDECVGYPDSDWAGDINYRKSTGYLFQIGGAPVSWRSKKQSCVALSLPKQNTWPWPALHKKKQANEINYDLGG